MLLLVLVSPESPSTCEVMVPQLSLLSVTFTLRTAQLFAEYASVWLVRRFPGIRSGVVRLRQKPHRSDAVSFPLRYIQRASCRRVLSSVVDLDRLVRMGSASSLCPEKLSVLWRDAWRPRRYPPSHALPLVSVQP